MEYNLDFRLKWKGGRLHDEVNFLMNLTNGYDLIELFAFTTQEIYWKILKC